MTTALRRRTYGRLIWKAAEGQGRLRGFWHISAEPQVMMRAKRVFGRVKQQRSGGIIVTDTAEVARDLEWFLERYPLEMDNVTAARLQGQADAHRDREQAILAALAGEGRDYGLRETAEPAREYQLVASDLILATGACLITDEVGLGKTLTGALTLRGRDALPAVVVTLTHLPGQWEAQINRFMPWLKTHVVRKGSPYDPTSLRGVDEEPDVLIIGYSKLAGWRDYLAGWAKTVIFDEIQELRHDGTSKYTAAAQIADGAGYKVGLTATPVYNYGIEAFNIVNVLAPDALGTREEFIREWCTGENLVNRGKVLVKNPGALGSFLRDQGLMLGRTRKEVGRELPQAVVVNQNVDCNPGVLAKAVGDAAEMARLVLDKAAGRTERMVASGQIDMLMRQATGVAKAPFVAAFVKLLLESEQNVVLYGWHREVYDLWLQALADYNPVLYTGTESPKQKAAHAEAFKRGDSRVLIMSLRSGAGLDGLQEHSKVVVFGELDWSPQVHHQCVGRLNRDGMDTSEPVVAYYLTTDGGSDPAIMEVLQVKRNQGEPMVNKTGGLSEGTQADPDRIKKLAASILEQAGQQQPEPSGPPVAEQRTGSEPTVGVTRTGQEALVLV